LRVQCADRADVDRRQPVCTAVLVESLRSSPIGANVVSVIVLSVINFIGADTLVFRAGRSPR
jgi:putative flippase GtrA